ncbi:hypothetical protein, partial [Pseudomonas urmiensis]|uniref:hypothetical protein n=1 Tax=Pseudomonas urmiensis TaxID=2745493 RepID=UPI0034D5132B
DEAIDSKGCSMNVHCYNRKNKSSIFFDARRRAGLICQEKHSAMSSGLMRWWFARQIPDKEKPAMGERA